MKLLSVVVFALVLAVQLPLGTAAQTDDPTPVTLGGQPAGTPIVAVDGVELLYLYATPIRQEALIRGELRNTTDQPLLVPAATVDLLDAGGAVLETVTLRPPTTLYTDVAKVIPAGGRVGLDGRTKLAPGGWATEHVSIGAVTPASQSDLDAQSPALEIFNLNEPRRTDTTLDVLGEIRNTSRTTAMEIEVQISYTLADGRYAGNSFGLAYPRTLAPGETGSFALYQAPTAVGTGWNYTLSADGVPSAATPPEVGQGVVELTPDVAFSGEPAVSRTGIAVSYVYAVENVDDDEVTLYGEMTNATDRLVATPLLGVAFYDATGLIVSSRGSSNSLSFIMPGASVPFEVATNLSPGAWARAVINMPASKPADPAEFAEGVVVKNASPVQTADHLTITGDLVNTGDGPVQFAGVTIMFRDANGRFVGDDSAFADTDRLDPGDRTTFSYDEDVELPAGWTYELVGRAEPND